MINAMLAREQSARPTDDDILSIESVIQEAIDRRECSAVWNGYADVNRQAIIAFLQSYGYTVEITEWEEGPAFAIHW